MSDTVVLMALFQAIDAIPDTLDRLREHGIGERDMSVISGIPYPARVLGRPMVWERLPLISLSGALVGMAIGLFLNLGTPLLYPIHVGGQALLPIPPTLVLTYELTMMGLIVSTFLGVLWESTFPSFGPKFHNPAVADGFIGLVFRCPVGKEDAFRGLLQDQGATEITKPEEQIL